MEDHITYNYGRILIKSNLLIMGDNNHINLYISNNGTSYIFPTHTPPQVGACISLMPNLSKELPKVLLATALVKTSAS